MRGSLGEKIGEGASADVHVWASGQVVKLFKSGLPRQVCSHEARMTSAVFAAGAPAPEVLAEMTLEGRFGIVLTRLDGPTLLQLLRMEAVTFEQAGAILANLALSVRNTPPPPEVLCLRDWFDGTLRLYDGRLPKHIAEGIRDLIERMPQRDVLCHADLHPGNVITTANGPKLVDWTNTVCAPAALDLAFCHVLLIEVAPEFVDNPQRPRAVNAALQDDYARLTGVSFAALAAAVKSCLPIACAMHIFWGARGTLRERLIQRVEAAFIPD